MSAVAYQERVESQRRRLLPALNSRLAAARSRLAATERTDYASERDYRRVRTRRLQAVRRLWRQVATLESGRLLAEWYEVATPPCCERCGALLPESGAGPARRGIEGQGTEGRIMEKVPGPEPTDPGLPRTVSGRWLRSLSDEELRRVMRGVDGEWDAGGGTDTPARRRRWLRVYAELARRRLLCGGGFSSG
jgi:hypothetical protein